MTYIIYSNNLTKNHYCKQVIKIARIQSLFFCSKAAVNSIIGKIRIRLIKTRINLTFIKKSGYLNMPYSHALDT